MYGYSTLILVFGYILAMAVVGMTYGGRGNNNDFCTFYIEYMVSIVVLPVAVVLLQLSILNQLT